MKDQPADIPADLSDVLRRKAEGRKDISRRSFGEKIAMMEALRERLAPFKKAREERRKAREQRRHADGASTSPGAKT
jgi:hypothetical protein